MDFWAAVVLLICAYLFIPINKRFNLVPARKADDHRHVIRVRIVVLVIVLSLTGWVAGGMTAWLGFFGFLIAIVISAPVIMLVWSQLRPIIDWPSSYDEDGKPVEEPKYGKRKTRKLLRYLLWAPYLQWFFAWYILIEYV